MSEIPKNQHDWKQESHRQAVMRIVESAHRADPFYDKKLTAKILLERSEMRVDDDGQIDIFATVSGMRLSKAYEDILEANHFRKNITVPRPVRMDDEPADMSVEQFRQQLRMRYKR